MVPVVCDVGRLARPVGSLWSTKRGRQTCRAMRRGHAYRAQHGPRRGRRPLSGGCLVAMPVSARGPFSPVVAPHGGRSQSLRVVRSGHRAPSLGVVCRQVLEGLSSLRYGRIVACTP